MSSYRIEHIRRHLNAIGVEFGKAFPRQETIISELVQIVIRLTDELESNTKIDEPRKCDCSHCAYGAYAKELDIIQLIDQNHVAHEGDRVHNESGECLACSLLSQIKGEQK